MSEENIEALQRAVEANNRRDYEAFLDEFDPDIEWHGIFGVMFGGEATVVRGHEGLLEYVRDRDEGFAVSDVQWSEFRDLGDRKSRRFVPARRLPRNTHLAYKSL